MDFKVGDRVKINAPHSKFHGKQCKIYNIVNFLHYEPLYELMLDIGFIKWKAWGSEIVLIEPIEIDQYEDWED